MNIEHLNTWHILVYSFPSSFWLVLSCEKTFETIMMNYYETLKSDLEPHFPFASKLSISKKRGNNTSLDHRATLKYISIWTCGPLWNLIRVPQNMDILPKVSCSKVAMTGFSRTYSTVEKLDQTLYENLNLA